MDITFNCGKHLTPSDSSGKSVEVHLIEKTPIRPTTGQAEQRTQPRTKSHGCASTI
jgi:hypothetical protein